MACIFCRFSPSHPMTALPSAIMKIARIWAAGMIFANRGKLPAHVGCRHQSRISRPSMVFTISERRSAEQFHKNSAADDDVSGCRPRPSPLLYAHETAAGESSSGAPSGRIRSCLIFNPDLLCEFVRFCAFIDKVCACFGWMRSGLWKQPARPVFILTRRMRLSNSCGHWSTI